jgi:hypothetical protein
MSHLYFCDSGGHEWKLECDCAALHEFVREKYSVCICRTCQFPKDEDDHSRCPIELRPCPEHLHQTRAEADAGGIPITMPPDADEKAERAFSQLETYVAACFWCGHGYDEYSRKAEAEHFAHNCPDAPEELRENAKRRLLLADCEHDYDSRELAEEENSHGES